MYIYITSKTLAFVDYRSVYIEIGMLDYRSLFILEFYFHYLKYSLKVQQSGSSFKILRILFYYKLIVLFHKYKLTRSVLPATVIVTKSM